MARANLKVTDDLAAAFRDAQTAPVRLLRLVVNAEEERIEAGGEPVLASDDAAADVEKYTTTLAGDVDTAVLCMNPESHSSKQWVLLSYVPDTAPPRVRMIAASSRQDIRSQLGYSLFAGDVHASLPEELSLGAIKASLASDAAPADSLSHAEKLKAKEHLESGVDRGLKTKAMGSVVPFSASDELLGALDAFAAGATALVEARVDADTEALQLASTAEAAVDAAGVSARMPADEPRFVAMTKDDGSPAFVLWCPDSAPPRLRMMYSTAKATLLELTEARGIKFATSLQAHSPSDLADDLAASAEPKAAAATLTEGGGFARPSRPGRGRARLIRRAKK